MLILTDDEVKAAVPMDQAIEVNEAAFKSFETGLREATIYPSRRTQRLVIPRLS